MSWLDEVEAQIENKLVDAPGVFDLLVEHTWRLEGGFSNHDADPGGKTRFGITEAVARNHGYEGDMESLPEQFALDVYRKSYFEGPGYHLVALRCLPLAKELFDAGVNLGPKRASLMFQRALNLLNRRGQDYPDLTPDGDVGGKTLDALDAFIARRGTEGRRVLVKALLAQRGSYYMDLAAQSEKFEVFLYGWLLNRVDMESVLHG